MYRVIISSFHHETNTFSKEKTGIQQYKERVYALGNAIIETYSDTESEMGGFIDELSKNADVKLIPVVMADAQPSGPVTAEMYEHVCSLLEKAIRQEEQIDGILLSLHGAMVTENSVDGEGDFLEFLRSLVGMDVPIVATLDLHSIITDKKIRNADVLINYDEYPHTDMFERGAEAAAIMVSILHGRVKPCQYVCKLPLILPSLSTLSSKMKEYVEIAHEFEKDPSVLTVSISHGFHFADIPESGASVVAVTNGDPELAQSIANQIGRKIWEDREKLQGVFYSLDEAISIVESSSEGPIIIADVTDNPGGGATCDGTAILRALLDRKIQDAIVAHICDRESLEACLSAGVGNYVQLQLGGKRCPAEIGTPVECRAYVKLLSDGKYCNIDRINGGYPITMGKTALIVIGGVSVIVSDSIEQPFDRGMLYAHGIDPTKKHCIVLKSTIHYRAAFEGIAAKILPVHIDGGLMTQDIKSIRYKRVNRPIYPLDDFDYRIL